MKLTVGSYFSNDTPYFKICQEMRLTGDFESLQESLQTRKLLYLVYVIPLDRVEISLILFVPSKRVPLNLI